MPAQLLLCADCGGSKTSAVLASVDTGEILARVLGGPSNFKYLGIKDFVAVITETLNRGLENHVIKEYLKSTTEKVTLPISNASLSPFHSAWIAVSGVDTPSDVKIVKEAMSDLLGTPRLQVTNDTHLLAGPLITQSKYPSCVTVVCGTGSCIVSFRKLSGRQLQELARSGGYGWILGDEGSGVQVGRETVRALCTQDDLDHLQGDHVVVKPTDTTPTHNLKALVLAYFGLPPTARPSDIFSELYAPDPNPSLASVQVKSNTSSENTNAHLLLERPQRLSRLAPAVFKAAFPPPKEQQSTNDNDRVFVPDPIASKVLHTTASELADKISMLCAPLASTLSASSKYVLASESILCLGGSLVKQVGYRTLLTTLLKERGHHFAKVLFVDDCEKAGVDALFAQGQESDG